MQIDWWLQPCAVFGHSFSGISWHMPRKWSHYRRAQPRDSIHYIITYIITWALTENDEIQVRVTTWLRTQIHSRFITLWDLLKRALPNSTLQMKMFFTLLSSLHPTIPCPHLEFVWLKTSMKECHLFMNKILNEPETGCWIILWLFQRCKSRKRSGWNESRSCTIRKKITRTNGSIRRSHISKTPAAGKPLIFKMNEFSSLVLCCHLEIEI